MKFNNDSTVKSQIKTEKTVESQISFFTSLLLQFPKIYLELNTVLYIEIEI